ncbi:GNAT family N-acetyltransferase [Metabacillus herbersteinensis]|uniref:GNAT family N-acetyltransferase n=1 Tax=Metabacillus herbersteinensis TaxID=283816 RepID=A0ABV6GA93_9BACI
MIIRTIMEEDAHDFLSCLRKLDTETEYMLFEPGERKLSFEDQKKRIQNVLQQENSTILLAVENGELAGFIAAFGGTVQRNKHSVSIVIGILEEHQGRGLGHSLFTSLYEWAKIIDLHRFELTAMSHNKKALSLYRKHGFEIEGVKKHSLKIRDTYIDEYYMGRILE